MQDSLPSVQVRHDSRRTRALPVAPGDDLDGLAVQGAGGATTVGEVLARSATDAWLVVHAGSIVIERYAAGASAVQRRPLMSITKSIVGTIAGILTARGDLDPAAPVTDHVPELAGSGYAGATVRDVLDMRCGVVFREEYTDPTSHIRRMDDAVAGRTGSPRGLHAYLATLRADRPHGGAFGYRSSDTDVLGWVCERAAGRPMADLISRLLWEPMGAEADGLLWCDVAGTAVSDGGLQAVPRDLARYGQLLLDGGTVGDRRVAPLEWIAQTWTVSADLRKAFAASAAALFLPGGWYRNQFWLLPGPHGDVMLGLGIYGQALRIDPATRTVIVKLSSWPVPQDPVLLHDTLRACDLVAAVVSGRPARTGPRHGPGDGRTRPVAGR